jgi:hypothetical protein
MRAYLPVALLCAFCWIFKISASEAERHSHGSRSRTGAQVTAAPGVGGWRCGVCLDVVRTFRAANPGLGIRSLTAPITLGGEATEDDTLAVSAPGCTAFHKGSKTRNACIRLRADLSQDAKSRYFVWASLSSGSQAYDVCTQLGKCDKLPTKDASGKITDTSGGGEAAQKCQYASRTAHCSLQPSCEAMASHCSDTCTGCVWLMKSWPQFKGVCAPEGGTTTAAPVKFAQTELSGRQSTHAQAAAQQEEDGEHVFGRPEKRDDPLDRLDGRDLGITDIFLQEEALITSVPAPPASKQTPNPVTSTGVTPPDSASTTPAQGPVVDIPLTESQWRTSQIPMIIPRGRGSPELDVSAERTPPNAMAAQTACFSLWNAVSALPEAWYAITAEDNRLLYPWDALTTCRCMSQCPFDSIDALAVGDTCAGLALPYTPEEQTQVTLGEGRNN